MANAEAFGAGFNAGRGKKQPAEKTQSFKKGGKVRKTGLAKVHKGEVVLTVKQAKRAKKGRKKTTAKR